MPSARILPLEVLAPSRSRWDLYFEILLAALLAFMPFALGAVEAWSELVVIAVALALALGLGLRTVFDREFRPLGTWTYLPLALFLFVSVLQLIPLPASTIQAVSAPTVAIRQELMGADAGSTETSTISLYPLATMHGLRLALAGFAIFATVASVFTTAAQVKRLLGWVIIVGTAQAVLALVQIFTFAERIHWCMDSPNRVTSGSFINYSNFSQFMNLSIGAGLGLLLVRLHEQRIRADASLSGAGLQEHGALMAAITVCAISVFASLSRNGAISLLIAAVVVGTALYRRGSLSRRGWLLAIVPMGVLGGVLAVAFDSIYARFSSLHETGFSARWQLTQDVLKAWRNFPIWGTGFGTHEFVFPMFDTSGAPILAAHADNDYAQLLEETGLVGAVLFAAFLVMIGVSLVRLCWRGSTPLSTAAFGLALGLLAVSIHSASDFGQHLPAVFALTAVSCGLVVRLARWEHDSPAGPQRFWAERAGARRLAGGAAIIGVALVGAWTLRGGWAACRGETWRFAALTMDDQIQSDVKAGASDEQLDEDYIDLLDASQEAVQSEPGNVVYGYWLNVYRWQSINRAKNPTTGKSVLPREAAPAVAQIADDLTTVRGLCPTYGPPYALEGLLRLTLLEEDRGRQLIQTGMRLAPYDATACMTAGEIAVREGRADDAASLLQRAVKLQPGYFAEAAELLLVQLGRPDLAEEMATDDFSRLQVLADLCKGSAKVSMLKADYQQKAESVLRRRVDGGEATAQEFAMLAQIEAQAKHAGKAGELFQRALALDYKQVEWHLALAYCLAAEGRNAEALHEARICLRLQPEHPEAKKLIETLSVTGQEQGPAA